MAARFRGGVAGVSRPMFGAFFSMFRVGIRRSGIHASIINLCVYIDGREVCMHVYIHRRELCMHV